MMLRSARHDGLRALLETGDAGGIRSECAGRVRNILAALHSADSLDELRGPPGWLIADADGAFSVTAAPGWRITFELRQGDVCGLDLEEVRG